MGRLVRLIILLGAAFIVLGVAAGALLYVVSDGRPAYFVQREFTRLRLAGQQEALNRSVGTDDTPVRFTVNPGDTPPIVAENLWRANLISNPDLYVDYALVSGLDVETEAGVYFPDQTLTIPQIAAMLTDSRSSYIPFRILEGWRMEEVAAAIDQSGLFGFSGADFLAIIGPGAEVDPAFANQVGLPFGASLEGFLYPDTYQLPPQIAPAGLRDLLVKTFLEKVGSQIIADASAQGLTFHQVIILASIVERESVQSEENPRIAEVYRNRLDIGMKLDADPTVQYGIGFQNGTWWPQITQDDYTNVISDYNTYRIPGLPPGPIANPSLAAIQGVVYPEASDYLYFRAACDGSGYHNFALTFEEHVANGC
ncbi:MAG: endolytic transglycosylase MltG [Anaerolineae bacterium]|nr:endolytic transglycosylase MltG [Anaerolineae bacterium]